MNGKTIFRAGLAGLVLSAGSAIAQDDPALSWSYLEGGLSHIDVDGDGETGFNVRGAAQLAEHFYLHGAWDRWEVDTIFGDEDIDLIKLGLGFRTAVTATSDLFVEASYAELELLGASTDGLRTDVGVRAAFGDRIDGRVFGGVQTDAFDEFEGILGADVAFGLTDRLGLVLSAETYEFDAEIYRVNLRLSF